MSKDEIIELYEDQPIRTAWNEAEEEWYFSLVDVVGVLTDSKDPTAYWRKLKQRLREEGNETVTNCHGLRMTAPDGKKRLTDVATTEQLLRIIQSIPGWCFCYIRTFDLSADCRRVAAYLDLISSVR